MDDASTFHDYAVIGAQLISPRDWPAVMHFALARAVTSTKYE